MTRRASKSPIKKSQDKVYIDSADIDISYRNYKGHGKNIILNNAKIYCQIKNYY